MVKRKGGLIKEMYAFTIIKNDTETVMSDIYETPVGQMLAPMVFHSAELIPEAREKAVARAKELGATVRLLRFRNPEVIDSLKIDKGLIIT